MPNVTTNALMDIFRAKIPGAADDIIKLEMFNVVGDIARDALLIDPPTNVDADPATWLSSSVWAVSFKAVQHGVLGHMYAHVKKPWSVPELAKFHFEQYRFHLERLRTDQFNPDNGGFTRILDDIRPRLIGAPDNLIKNEAFAALREFFRESTVWRDSLDTTVYAGQTIYDLTPNDRGAICTLLYAYDGNGIPVAATMASPTEIVLDNVPGTAQIYTFVVALTVRDPVITSIGFPVAPSWIVEQYADTIVDGTVGRMMSHANKAWTNQQMAVYHLRRFRNGIAQARIAAERANTRRQAWVFPQTFRVSRRHV